MDYLYSLFKKLNDIKDITIYKDDDKYKITRNTRKIIKTPPTEYSESYHEILNKKHHVKRVINTVYRNPFKTWFEIELTDFYKLVKDGFFKDIDKLYEPETLTQTLKELVIEQPTYNITPTNPADIQITWFGHSTYLIQHNGINILTDPIRNQASPVSWRGPKRFISSIMDIAKLPKIDVVLISHNHFDHLDRDTCVEIEQYHKPHWLCGQGEGKFFTKKSPSGLNIFKLYVQADPKRVIEKDWYEGVEFTINGKVFKFTFTPAQHWTVRKNYLKKNMTLWGNWVVQSEYENIFFSCDTGYCEGFADIGKRFKKFKVAIIPVGAYGSDKHGWFLQNQHIDVAEAIQIAIDLRAENAIGSHCETFGLTDEPTLGPRRMLKKLLEENELPADWFIIMNHFQTRIYK